jgi:hypothetical protein
LISWLPEEELLEDESLVQRALQVDKAAWNEQRAMSVSGDSGVTHLVDACLLISWLLEDELLEDESLVQGALQVDKAVCHA